MLQRRATIFIVFLVILSLLLIYISALGFIVPRSNNWAFDTTQIDKLHGLGFDGSKVTIGIVDTGVDRSHQEFDDSSFIAWSDYINHKSKCYDDDDHGTHIAGLIVSKGSFQGLFSGINLQGIASDANIVVVKSIPQNQYIYGGGNDSTISEGIKFCIEHNVDIILLSMGMSPRNVDFINNSKTTEMIEYAVNMGVFVVCPAGNDGQDDNGDVCFPSIVDDVISVGAVSKENFISSFSSKGHQYPGSDHPNKKPELVAPGEKLLSTRITGAYGRLSGTSQAAAYVAGIIALLLDAYPEYKHDGYKNQNKTTIELFKDILAKTAKKIGNLQGNTEEYSHDDYYGYGLIQAFDAYKELAKY